MNVHWMVFYELEVFCSNMKFKMAVTAGLEVVPFIINFSTELTTVVKFEV